MGPLEVEIQVQVETEAIGYHGVCMEETNIKAEEITVLVSMGVLQEHISNDIRFNFTGAQAVEFVYSLNVSFYLWVCK